MDSNKALEGTVGDVCEDSIPSLADAARMQAYAEMDAPPEPIKQVDENPLVLLQPYRCLFGLDREIKIEIDAGMATVTHGSELGVHSYSYPTSAEKAAELLLPELAKLIERQVWNSEYAYPSLGRALRKIRELTPITADLHGGN